MAFQILYCVFELTWSARGRLVDERGADRLALVYPTKTRHLELSGVAVDGRVLHRNRVRQKEGLDRARGGWRLCVGYYLIGRLFADEALKRVA